ncbi:MAG: hypothetical protein WA151_09035, partial [Desulfatirhabdiaceae bacterium]
MTENTSEKLDPHLDPKINKCVTCGLFRVYTVSELDGLFASLGHLHKAGKINYKINRVLIGPDEATIFCSVGLPQAMKIDEACHFHQPKFDYPIEHYSAIHSATLSKILAEDTRVLTIKTKRLAVIA